MRAGILTDKITVQAPTTIQNKYGANTTEWKEYINTRAEITYNSGNRQTENNEIVFNYTVLFKVRRYHDIKEQMRIIWNGNKYRIISINKDIKKQFILITTELINE